MRDSLGPAGADREGVIKYRLDFHASPAVFFPGLANLNAWRRILLGVGLVGRDDRRYGGLGFGNLSMRCPEEPGAFFITGTQTGGLQTLGAEHYARVESCDPLANRIKASGPVRPSSEALTHGAVYQVRPDCRYIFHAHSPAIWRQAEALQLPETGADIEYGTPAMAEAFWELLGEGGDDGVLVMRGHQDGVVSFANTAAGAGARLIEALAAALALEDGS